MKFLKKSIFPGHVSQNDVSILGKLAVEQDITANTLIGVEGVGIDIEGVTIKSNEIDGVNAVHFDPYTPISGNSDGGTLYWDANNDTLNLGSSNLDYDIPLNQKLVTKGINKTLSVINRGKIVYLSGSSDNTTTFDLASAESSSDSTSMQLGITDSNISVDASSALSLVGIIKKINTSAWTEGTSLYLSATNPGDFTDVMPTSPNKIVWCGIVTKQHLSEGEIFFNPKTPSSAGSILTSLEDLSDTSIGTPIINDTLVHNGTDWVNEQKDWKVENDLMSPTDSSVNMELGSIQIEEDAGEVTLVDMAVTGTATIGTIESYSLDMDHSPVAKIYGKSNGIGGVTDRSFVIETQYQYMGDPETDGTWRFGVVGVSLVFQRRESGIWVIYQTINP